jgi:hypothetical protein
MSLFTPSGITVIKFFLYLLTIGVFSLTTPSHADTTTSLPLGVILDSQGNPIPLPTKQQSALEIPSLKSSKKSKQTQHKSTKKTSRTKPKKRSLSAKQQLASRASVANDPSCRWLNARMDQLENKLTYEGNSGSKSYHQKELSTREREWKCMKCGTEGPNQVDRDKCQQKR